MSISPFPLKLPSNKPLATWAEFYLGLGEFMIRPTGDPGSRRVFGAAIPARNFAAVLAAVGAVTESIGGRSAAPEGDVEYFERLCGLPVGTRVKFRDTDKNGRERLLEGKLDGFQDVSSPSGVKERYLKIQVEKSSMKNPAAGGRKSFVPVKRVRAVNLAVSEDEVPTDNLPVNQRGRLVAPTSSFAESVIGSGKIAQFEQESKMTCLIVGSRAAIEAESTEFDFLSATGRYGTLAELLRLRRLGGSRPFRSDTFSANSRRPPRLHQQPDFRPELVIFDGAAGFLKWRNYFPVTDWLVFLDHTETRFDEAIQTLNNHYLQRSISEPSIEDVPIIPDGVEIIFFQEVKK